MQWFVETRCEEKYPGDGKPYVSLSDIDPTN